MIAKIDTFKKCFVLKFAFLLIFITSCNAEPLISQVYMINKKQVQGEDIPDKSIITNHLCGETYLTDDESKAYLENNFDRENFSSVNYQNGKFKRLLRLVKFSRDEIVLKNNFVRLYAISETGKISDITNDSNSKETLSVKYPVIKVKNNIISSPCKHDIFVCATEERCDTALKLGADRFNSDEDSSQSEKAAKDKKDSPENRGNETELNPPLPCSRKSSAKNNSTTNDFDLCKFTKNGDSISMETAASGTISFNFSDKNQYIYINGIRYSSDSTLAKGEMLLEELDKSAFTATSSVSIKYTSEKVQTVEIWNKDIKALWNGEKQGCKFSPGFPPKCVPEDWIYLMGTSSRYSSDSKNLGVKAILRYKNRYFTVNFNNDLQVSMPTLSISNENDSDKDKKWLRLEESANMYIGPVVVKIFSSEDGEKLVSVSDIFSVLYPDPNKKTLIVKPESPPIIVEPLYLIDSYIEMIYVDSSNILFSHNPKELSRPEQNIHTNISDIMKTDTSFGEKLLEIIEALKSRGDMNSLYITHSSGKIIDVSDEEVRFLNSEKKNKKIMKHDLTFKIIGPEKKSCYLLAQEQNAFSRVFVLRFEQNAVYVDDATSMEHRSITTGSKCSFIDIPIDTCVKLDAYISYGYGTYYIVKTRKTTCEHSKSTSADEAPVWK